MTEYQKIGFSYKYLCQCFRWVQEFIKFILNALLILQLVMLHEVKQSRSDCPLAVLIL
jgi:hypothetical protein